MINFRSVTVKYKGQEMQTMKENTEMQGQSHVLLAVLFDLAVTSSFTSNIPVDQILTTQQ